MREGKRSYRRQTAQHHMQAFGVQIKSKTEWYKRRDSRHNVERRAAMFGVRWQKQRGGS